MRKLRSCYRPSLVGSHLEYCADTNHRYSETFSTRACNIVHRPVGQSDDVQQVQRWLKACLATHDSCSQRMTQEMSTPQITPSFPTRVINVGSSDGSTNPFLFETEGLKGQYLALSHRWGNAKITKTTITNIAEHKKHIQLDSLCQVFQDAIYFTRKLGYRYLWIDSLCIIQDSLEDWELEASRMSEVYTNSILTLSASVATSGDIGLFYPREESNSVEIPVRRAQGGALDSFSITDRLLSTFKEDVRSGTLSQRAWCLQERVLSPRILHFGKSQLHWECISGCWSESSIEAISEPDAFSGDIESKLRQQLYLTTWPSLEETLKILEVNDKSPLKQVYGRGPYGKWYLIITAYSSRMITNDQDRLPALAGLAKSFKQFSGDEYAAGLWIDDIPAGLLWSGLSFYASRDSPSPLRRPTKHCAPSWSWASFEGPITYPLGKLGKIDIPRDWKYGFVASTPDTFGRVEQGFIELSGRLRKLGSMIGFTADYLENTKEFSEYFLQDQIARALYDEPGLYKSDDVMCLLIAFQGCGSKTCNHNAGCHMRFAYSLLLHRSGNFGTFKRVGIALTYQSDWIGVQRTRIVIS